MSPDVHINTFNAKAYFEKS